MANRQQQASRQQYLIGPEARRQMSEMWAWYQRHESGGGNLPNEPTSRFGPRTVRIARTTTSIAFPTYPSRPANTFVVEFGTTEFEPAPGLQTLSFDPYDPEEKRVAHDPFCNYHEEDTLVLVYLVHDQWYILKPVSELLAFAELDQDLCDETDEIALTNVKRYPDCDDLTVTTATNPRLHRGKNGQQVLLVKKSCRVAGQCSSEEEWEIVDIEKREVCVAVGIKDTEGCLVYAALTIAAEWCPTDEPTTACVIVDYTECGTGSGVCDEEWTFDPLYACCGNGSGSG